MKKTSGVLPDLRHMSAGKYIVFEEIVLGGILKNRGLAGSGHGGFCRCPPICDSGTTQADCE